MTTLTNDEKLRAAQWLHDRAAQIEDDEPYAINTIEALREAARVLDEAAYD